MVDDEWGEEMAGDGEEQKEKEQQDKENRAEKKTTTTPEGNTLETRIPKPQESAPEAESTRPKIGALARGSMGPRKSLLLNGNSNGKLKR